MMHATSNKNLEEFGEEGEEYTTHAFEGMKIKDSKSYSNLQDTSCWSRLYKRTSCAHKM